jgi:hypothetical protein
MKFLLVNLMVQLMMKMCNLIHRFNNSYNENTAAFLLLLDMIL